MQDAIVQERQGPNVDEVGYMNSFSWYRGGAESVGGRRRVVGVRVEHDDYPDAAPQHPPGFASGVPQPPAGRRAASAAR
jgi:hypothetical protein